MGMDLDAEAVLPPPAAPQGDVEGPDLTTLYDPSKLDENTRHAPEYIKQLFGEQDWWPWLDKESCLMDIMGVFPRALFSESELEATKWFAERNGASGLPDIKAVKRQRDRVLQAASLKPMTHEGPMARSTDGKNYYVEEIALANLDEMGRHFLVDEREKSTLNIPLSAFLLSVQELESPAIQSYYNLPSPSAVEVMIPENCL
ncbi:hypothetical protein B0H21DRAFT_710651 [Amylocystis lapponica]|nr:hypothetical protein B0H21DRAFT_710651 [Amylocystis lapponica]